MPDSLKPLHSPICNRPSCKHDGSIATLNANIEIFKTNQQSQERKIDRIDQAIGSTEHDISTSLNNFSNTMLRFEILIENQSTQIKDIATEQQTMNKKIDGISNTIRDHARDICVLNKKADEEDRQDDTDAVKEIRNIKKSLLIWVGGLAVGIGMLMQLSSIIDFFMKAKGH